MVTSFSFIFSLLLITQLPMKHFGLYSTEILYQSGISGRSYVSRYERCLYEGYPVLIKI